MEHLSPDHAAVIVDRTVVVALRRPPTAAMLTSLEARIRAAVRVQQTKLAYLHVVLDVPTTGRVEEDTRAAFVATARRSLHHFEGAAMVLMGEGFRGAAMRAAVSGALLVVRPSVPVRTFSRVEEGALWLSSLPSASPRDAATLEGAAAELSAALLRDYTP